MSQLPEGWAKSTVKELIATDGLFSDGDWVESKDQDPNGSNRLIQLADIGDGIFLNKSHRFVNDETFVALNCTELKENDVLIARMPAPLGRACLMPALSQRCITVVDVAILRPGSDSVGPRWLMHFINSPAIRETIELLSTGTTRQRISRGNLSILELPVPPLNEQKRIAAKLDALLARVDDCREWLKRVPLILKGFRQTVLAAATSGQLTEGWRNDNNAGRTQFTFPDADSFGGYQFPASWEAFRLGEIADISSGLTKDKKKQDAVYTELPYLRVANVQRGFFDLSEIKTIRVPPNRVEELLLKPGDILFNEGGDIDKLGRGWVWSGEIERCTFQNHVFRARLNDSSFEPKFFSFYGNSRGYDYFLSKGKQTTNLASINRSILAALPVVVPPAAEQREIVRRVETLFAYTARLEAPTIAPLSQRSRG